MWECVNRTDCSNLLLLRFVIELFFIALSAIVDGENDHLIIHNSERNNCAFFEMGNPQSGADVIALGPTVREVF